MQRAKINDCVYMTLTLCEGLLLVMRAGSHSLRAVQEATPESSDHALLLTFRSPEL